MLFVVTYAPRSSATQEHLDEAVHLFSHWQPPEGLTFRRHYLLARGGGVAIVETDSEMALYEVISAFSGVYDFDVHPAMEIDQALPVLTRLMEWRASQRSTRLAEG